MSDADRLLDADEVADLLHVKTSWVRTHTKSKAIPHLYLGRYPRYRRADVLAWIEDCSKPGRPVALRREVTSG